MSQDCCRPEAPSVSRQASLEERYSRQIRFHEIGEEGQRKIRGSRVALVGCGGLGSAQAEILARAGVGFLRIIDRDYIDWSNLQRQWLFDEKDAETAMPKAAAAAARLREINSTVEIEPAVTDLTPSNIDDLLDDVHLIMDATDNFETRFLINDYAVSHNVPWIYGAAVGSYGLKMPVIPGKTCCLRCIMPELPGGVQQSCETAGILASTTTAVAALQAADALKILSGHIDEIAGKTTVIDVWTGEVMQVKQAERNPDCPTCARGEFTFLTGKQRAPISLCGRNAVQIHDRRRPVDLHELAAQLKSVGEVRMNDFALRAEIAPYELTVFPDGRAIIKGTTDVGVAKSIYARYVGN